MSVAITEIVRRSEQGVTRPFLCRSADGTGYFVKGIVGAGAESLRAEWVCGKLAQTLGLPIPDYFAGKPRTMGLSRNVKSVARAIGIRTGRPQDNASTITSPMNVRESAMSDRCHAAREDSLTTDYVLPI